MHWFLQLTLNLITVSPGLINVGKKIYLYSYTHTEEWRETQRRLNNLPVSITQRNLCFQRMSQIQVRGDEFKQESSYRPWPFWATRGNISQHCETTAESGRAQGENCHYCPTQPIQRRHPPHSAQPVSTSTHLHWALWAEHRLELPGPSFPHHLLTRI